MIEPMEGEFDLIARLRSVVEGEAPAGEPGRVRIASGDDAAVTIPGGATATSVDSLVEGVHFRRETAPLQSIGRKALAAALSDLAAMGAEAGEAYVQIGVPEDLDAGEAEQLAAGLGACASDYGVVVLGGDVSRSPVLSIGITVVGHATEAEALVARSGARPGDILAVTGELGGAAAGLLLLERPELAGAVEPELADELRARQLEPEPRLAAGRALAKAGATAMIDVSDGLAGDAAHLAVASGAHLVIELARLPVARGVEVVAQAAGADPAGLAASGGEDYELLVAIPAERLPAAAEAAGVELTEIGRVEEGAGVALIDALGAERSLHGFDQLRASPSPGEPS